MRISLVVLALALGAAPLSAQRIPDITTPIRKAQAAADSTNARTAAQTGQAIPERNGVKAPLKPSGPGAPVSRRAAPVAAAPLGAGTGTVGRPGGIEPVTREVFTYEADGRRDPFFSLILTEDLRPLLTDLKLVGILYEASGRRSVAIMRDILTNAQYRVNVGQTLGRMRVAQIKPRAVIFTIDEFGLSRQDSLFLIDSTKVRIR